MTHDALLAHNLARIEHATRASADAVDRRVHADGRSEWTALDTALAAQIRRDILAGRTHNVHTED